ncbi:MAG TPA: AtpZ/AtpI family protein [Candidatus Aminicenantes bacterium]|nr:AtpZ/AtpI family protein [Candidatus Aminicenantes bacterium]
MVERNDKGQIVNRDDAGRSRRSWVDYSSVGLVFPVSIAVGFGMGYMLDRWLRTAPIFTILFVLYGVAAGFVNLFKVSRRHEK